MKTSHRPRTSANMKLKRWLLLPVIALLSIANGRAALTGAPIVDNNYRLDLRQGPVTGSAKQVALGGAYIGIAEGIASLGSNPAGVAFRPTRSTEKFDWDWTAGVNDLASNDFDNNGYSPPDYASHRMGSLGLMAQYGAWGIGLLSNSEIIKLEKYADRDDEYVLSASSLAVGRQFDDQQWTLGLGMRATSIRVRSSRTDLIAGELSGIGWQAGMLWNPERGPWRLGLSYASAISSRQLVDPGASAPTTVDGLIIPAEVTLPPQLGLGASYRTSSASFWPGRPWLMTADLVIIGKSENAVGVESVLAQVTQPVGTRTTVSFRVGSELEALPGRARLRLGAYYEPAFYEAADSRTHLTGGFELRLFQTRIWGEHDWNLTYSFDVARDYVANFLSIGFWYF